MIETNAPLLRQTTTHDTFYLLWLLLLKDAVILNYQSTYEPGKRHWLKIKKDYLADGTMADTADLVVLGAYFGTGGKGMYSCVYCLY